MGHVVDRWTVPNPATGKRVKGPRHGQGKRWLARWPEADGRERSKAFAAKDAAVAHLADVDTAQRAGTYVRPSRVTFRAYADGWLAAQLHHRPGTATTARRRLTNHAYPAFGGVPIGQVTRADVQAMIVAASGDLAASTVRLLHVYVRAVFAAAAEDRLIRDSPCRRIRLPEVPPKSVDPLSVEQVRTLAGALVDVRDDGDGRRGRRLGHLQAMLLVGAATGLRPGELRAVTADRLVGDAVRVDRQLDRAGHGSVPVFGPLKTKASYRVVPLAPSTVKVLGEHVERYGPGPAGLVFCKPGGFVVDRKHLAYAWEVASAGMGLPPRTGWHDLRHHHASLLIGAGLSPRAVADRLGHADPSETLRTYAHLWPSDQQRILDAVEVSYGPGADQG